MFMKRLFNSKNFMRKYFVISLTPYLVLWIISFFIPVFRDFGKSPIVDFIHYLVVIPIWFLPLIFILWFLERIKPKKN
jgi:hypothetical protein